MYNFTWTILDLTLVVLNDYEIQHQDDWETI